MPVGDPIGSPVVSAGWPLLAHRFGRSCTRVPAKDCACRQSPYPLGTDLVAYPSSSRSVSILGSIPEDRGVAVRCPVDRPLARASALAPSSTSARPLPAKERANGGADECGPRGGER